MDTPLDARLFFDAEEDPRRWPRLSGRLPYSEVLESTSKFLSSPWPALRFVHEIAVPRPGERVRGARQSYKTSVKGKNTILPKDRAYGIPSECIVLDSQSSEADLQ